MDLIGLWILAMIPSAICGGIIGGSKDARGIGAMIGFLFGPLGVVAAFALDQRHECPTCHGRLNRTPKVCMYCRSELQWLRRS